MGITHTDLPVELPKTIDAILLDEFGVFPFSVRGVLNIDDPTE